MIPINKTVLVQDLLCIQYLVEGPMQTRILLKLREGNQVFTCTRPKWYVREYLKAIKNPDEKKYLWIIRGNVVEPFRGETILKFSEN